VFTITIAILKYAFTCHIFWKNWLIFRIFHRFPFLIGFSLIIDGKNFPCLLNIPKGWLETSWFVLNVFPSKVFEKEKRLQVYEMRMTSYRRICPFNENHRGKEWLSLSRFRFLFFIDSFQAFWGSSNFPQWKLPFPLLQRRRSSKSVQRQWTVHAMLLYLPQSSTLYSGGFSSLSLSLPSVVFFLSCRLFTAVPVSLRALVNSVHVHWQTHKSRDRYFSKVRSRTWYTVLWVVLVFNRIFDVVLTNSEGNDDYSLHPFHRRDERERKEMDEQTHRRSLVNISPTFEQEEE